MKVIVFFIVLLSVLACNPKDPCANLVCKANQECIEGSCQCIANSYNMGTWCAPKSNNASDVFYSKSNNCGGCLLSDTAVAFLSKNGETGIGTYSFMMAFPKDEKYSSTAVGAGWEGQYYYKRADGDSFKIIKPSALFCKENRTRPPIIYGKVSPSRDSLRLKIVWHDPAQMAWVPIDSCTKLFTR